MKRFFFSILVIVLAGSFFLPITRTDAQVVSPAGTCSAADRFRNWDIFIQHGLSYNDWASNWKDIFGRSACQRDDIFVLQERLEKVREQIRQNIYTCNYKALDNLTRLEVRLQTELEYVRLVVDSDTERSPGDGSSEVMKRNRTRVYQEMYKDLIDTRHLFDKEYFDELFLEFENHYQARVDDYISCTDATWEELSDKWNIFVDSAAGIKPAWDRLETAVDKKWDKLLKKSPSARAGNYLGGFLDVKLNGLEPKKALSEIIGDLSENSPGGSARILDVLNRHDAEKYRFSYEENRVQRLARYNAIYKNGSDDVVTTFVDQLHQLNQIIQDTFPVLRSLYACVDSVSEKQCS